MRSVASEVNKPHDYLATIGQHLNKETALQNIRDSILLLTNEENIIDALDSREKDNFKKLLKIVDDKYFNEYLELVASDFRVGQDQYQLFLRQMEGSDEEE